MSTLTHIASTLAAFSAALVLTLSSAQNAQAADPVQVKDYDVFVDLPTAFAFVKLPTGWKFVGKLDAEQLRRLPAGTITSLLPDDDSAVRLAADAESDKKPMNRRPRVKSNG